MHYTDSVEKIKMLKREKHYDEAITLLFKCVTATEKESLRENCGVAPWYYEQLAIIYRKTGRNEKEIEILERFANQQKAPGVKPERLMKRLQQIKGL